MTETASFGAGELVGSNVLGKKQCLVVVVVVVVVADPTSPYRLVDTLLHSPLSEHEMVQTKTTNFRHGLDKGFLGGSELLESHCQNVAIVVAVVG